MRKKIVQWSLIIVVLVVGGTQLLKVFGFPLYRDFYTLLVTILLALLAIFDALFERQKSEPRTFKETVINFFAEFHVMVTSILLVVILVMWIISGDKPEAKPEQPEVITPSPTDTVKDNESGDKSETAPEDEKISADAGGPCLFLSDWENDPFFLNIDKYCGRHVDEASISNEILELLRDSQLTIEVKGQYSSELLAGADSKYAEHIRRANDLHRGYQLFLDNELLPDYQVQLLEEEIQERKLADELFPVSENRKIIGDTYLRLGNIYSQANDINKAHECYTEAFSSFQAAYRTCIAEGSDLNVLRIIVDRITNASEKLTMLAGVDSREQDMAPEVAAAFGGLMEAMAA